MSPKPSVFCSRKVVTVLSWTLNSLASVLTTLWLPVGVARTAAALASSRAASAWSRSACRCSTGDLGLARWMTSCAVACTLLTTRPRFL